MLLLKFILGSDLILRFLSSSRGYFLVLLLVIILEGLFLFVKFSSPKQKKDEVFKYKIDYKTVERKEYKKDIPKKIIPKKIQKVVEKKVQKKEIPKKVGPSKEQVLQKEKAKKIATQKKEQERKRLKKLKEEKLKREEIERQKKLELQKIKEQKQRVVRIRKEYIKNVRTVIGKNQKYPIISRAKKEEGVVEVSFRVYKNGQIKNIKIVTSSGFKRLDKAALKVIKKLVAFDVLPKDLKEDFLDMLVPISYKIRR